MRVISRFGLGLGLGLGAAVAQIQYLLRLALNASNTAPLTALTGDTATQVATSSVVVPNNAGTLVTLPAGYPAIEGAEVSYDTADGAVLGTSLTIGAASAWTVSDGNGSASTIAVNTTNPLVGTEDVILDVTTQASAGGRPYITHTTAATDTRNKVYKIHFKVKRTAGTGGQINSYNVLGGSAVPVVLDGTVQDAYVYADYRAAGAGSATQTSWSAFFVIGATGTFTAQVDVQGVYEITPALLAPSEATATVLSSGLTRYTGNTYGQPGLGVLAEPSLTNKVACQKANPTVTTNIAKSGDAASVLSIVDDTAALTAAGLIGICTLGDVYSLDNSAGTATATASMLAATGNTNKHSLSVYARKVSGTGTSNLNLENVASGATITGATYAKYKWENITPVTAADRLQVRAGVGDVVYFILPQLEESPVATSPIFAVPETTAAVTRASRYTTIAGSELGTDFHVDANVKNLGTEMALIGDPTSLAYLYKNSADKVVWRGSSLGADLVDTMNTAAAWTVYGTNTVADDAGEVKITCVSDALGANATFSAAAGLTTNLTVGKTYEVRGLARVNAGSNVQIYAYWGAGLYNNFGIITSTTNVAWSGRFVCTHASANYLTPAVMAVGEIIWLSGITVKEVKELTSTSSLVASTPATIGVHNGTDGASLYINGTAEATDATMQTPVVWGTTVRVGADMAATAGKVLNGSVHLIHSSDDDIASEVN